DEQVHAMLVSMATLPPRSISPVQSVTIPPNPIEGERYELMGRHLTQQGSYSSAISVLLISLTHDPSRPTAYNALGYAQHLSGDDTAALRSYDQPLTLAPAYINARLNRDAAALSHTRRTVRNLQLTRLAQ